MPESRTPTRTPTALAASVAATLLLALAPGAPAQTSDWLFAGELLASEPTFNTRCNSNPDCSASAREIGSEPTRSPPPLMPTIRWNNPFASGLACKLNAELAPADCPITVTRAGSPPTRSMFLWIHCSAAS